MARVPRSGSNPLESSSCFSFVRATSRQAWKAAGSSDRKANAPDPPWFFSGKPAPNLKIHQTCSSEAPDRELRDKIDRPAINTLRITYPPIKERRLNRQGNMICYQPQHHALWKPDCLGKGLKQTTPTATPTTQIPSRKLLRCICFFSSMNFPL